MLQNSTAVSTPDLLLVPRNKPCRPASCYQPQRTTACVRTDGPGTCASLQFPELEDRRQKTHLGLLAPKQASLAEIQPMYAFPPGDQALDGPLQQLQGPVQTGSSVRACALAKISGCRTCWVVTIDKLP